jgi:hypothetical protein
VSELRRERDKNRTLETELDEVAAKCGKLESESLTLKEKLFWSEKEMERLGKKAVTEWQARTKAEEELIKFRASGESGYTITSGNEESTAFTTDSLEEDVPRGNGNMDEERTLTLPPNAADLEQLEALRQRLSIAEDALERERGDRLELEQKLVKFERRETKQGSSPYRMSSSWCRGTRAEKETNHVNEDLEPLSARLEKIRRDNSILMASTLPASIQQRSVQVGTTHW